jgi:citrate synthase
MNQPQICEGLAGVLVARTELSWVEGERGRLTVRGRRIESLVSELPFEAMVGLLLEGSVPEPSPLSEIRA